MIDPFKFKGMGNIAYPFDDPQYLREPSDIFVQYLVAAPDDMRTIIERRDTQELSEEDDQRHLEWAGDVTDFFDVLDEGRDPVEAWQEQKPPYIQDIALFDWIGGRFRNKDSNPESKWDIVYWDKEHTGEKQFTPQGKALYDQWYKKYGMGALIYWRVIRDDNLAAQRVLQATLQPT